MRLQPFLTVVFLWAGAGLAALEFQKADFYNQLTAPNGTEAELILPLPGAVAGYPEREHSTIKLVVGAAEKECGFDNVWINNAPLFQKAYEERGVVEVLLDNEVRETFLFKTAPRCSPGTVTGVVVRFYQHGFDHGSAVSVNDGVVVVLKLLLTQTGAAPTISDIRYLILDEELALELEHKQHPAVEGDISGTPVPSSSHDAHVPAQTSLQDELLALDILQHHAAEIEKEIKATQARIMQMWRLDFAKCTSLKCYFKTALAKGPAFAHLVATHFSHHTHLDAGFFRNSTHMNCTDEVERVVSQHEQQMTLVDTSAEAKVDDEGPVRVSDYNDNDPVPSVAPTNDEPISAFPPSTTSTTDSTTTNKPPQWRHKRPPWRQAGPPWRQHGPPWMSPASSTHAPHPPFHFPDGSKPNPNHGAPPPFDSSPDHHNQTNNDHGQPTFFTLSSFYPSLRTRLQLAFILLAISLTSVFILSLSLFLCIRRCRDPRRRAERAARREERVTRALYRKAACKYKWTTFWQRCFSVFTVTYWVGKAAGLEGEKGLTVVTVQEHGPSSAPNDNGRGGNIITSQINNLRAAHALVRQLMRVEEGQRGSSLPTRATEATASSSNAPRASEAARSTETLPAYSLPPPSYHSRKRGDSDADTTSLLASESESGSESESEGISVVDGFTGYTPSTQSRSGVGSKAVSEGRSRSQSRHGEGRRSLLEGVEMDTESSVVTCSPRLSMESERRF